MAIDDIEISPPIFEAAMPVLAVMEITEVFFEYLCRSPEMIWRNNSDFPVPFATMVKRWIRDVAKAYLQHQ